MKCSACFKNLCNGEYRNNFRCIGNDQGIHCSCNCKIVKSEIYLRTISSALVGLFLMLVVICTHEIMNSFICGAIIGTMKLIILSPIIKFYMKENFLFKDFFNFIAFGAAIGLSFEIVETPRLYSQFFISWAALSMLICNILYLVVVFWDNISSTLSPIVELKKNNVNNDIQRNFVQTELERLNAYKKDFESMDLFTVDLDRDVNHNSHSHGTHTCRH